MPEPVHVLGRSARFTDRKVHLFRETSGEHGISYCGLSEWSPIWREHGLAVTCLTCTHLVRKETPDAHLRAAPLPQWG